MRILLNENMPHGLRGMLVGHDARTTAHQGWAGLANGELLKAADEGGFDALITADQGVRYQQNRIRCYMALIVVSTNKETSILANADSILAALDAATTGALVFVDLGN